MVELKFIWESELLFPIVQPPYDLVRIGSSNIDLFFKVLD